MQQSRSEPAAQTHFYAILSNCWMLTNFFIQSEHFPLKMNSAFYPQPLWLRIWSASSLWRLRRDSHSDVSTAWSVTFLSHSSPPEGSKLLFSGWMDEGWSPKYRPPTASQNFKVSLLFHFTESVGKFDSRDSGAVSRVSFVVWSRPGLQTDGLHAACTQQKGNLMGSLSLVLQGERTWIWLTHLFKICTVSVQLRCCERWKKNETATKTVQQTNHLLDYNREHQ